MFPIFRVESLAEGGGVLGSVTRTVQGNETWVSDQSLGYLEGGDEVIAGRWRQQGERWSFAPDRQDLEQYYRSFVEPGTLAFIPGETL